MKPVRSNLCVHGVVRGFGGVFDEVDIDGVGSIRGDVECQVWQCCGRVRLDGNLRAGEALFCGDVAVLGSLHAGRVEIEGVVKVQNDCEADVFRVKGGFRVGGLINADTVEIELSGPAKAAEIGGGTIRVVLMKPPGRIVRWLRAVYPGFGGLTVGAIEGDDIRLEGVCADIVRGNDIVVGPGCSIRRIEYRRTFHPAADAEIREVHKLE